MWRVKSTVSCSPLILSSSSSCRLVFLSRMEGVLFLKNNKSTKSAVTNVKKNIGQLTKGDQKQPVEEDLTLGVNKAWDKRYCKIVDKKKLMIYDGNYDTSANRGKLLDQIEIVNILSPYDVSESIEHTSRADNIYAFQLKLTRPEAYFVFASFSSTVRERWVQEIQLIVRQEVQSKNDKLIGVPAKVVQDENKMAKIGPVLDRVESYNLTTLDLSDMNLLEIPKGRMV